MSRVVMQTRNTMKCLERKFYQYIVALYTHESFKCRSEPGNQPIRDVKFPPKSGLGTEPAPHVFWMGPASRPAFIAGPGVEPGSL